VLHCLKTWKLQGWSVLVLGLLRYNRQQHGAAKLQHTSIQIFKVRIMVRRCISFIARVLHITQETQSKQTPATCYTESPLNNPQSSHNSSQEASSNTPFTIFLQWRKASKATCSTETSLQPTLWTSQTALAQ
jgi:hypothetical protein